MSEFLSNNRERNCCRIQWRFLRRRRAGVAPRREWGAPWR